MARNGIGVREESGKAALSAVDFRTYSFIKLSAGLSGNINTCDCDWLHCNQIEDEMVQV